jgi:predicted DsbA family dithiol-disulfide isomerase
MSTLEVYADLWCPFAYVGLSAAFAARRSRAVEDPIWIRAWPLELVNGVGLDPATTQAHVDELREQVAPELFGGFELKRFPSSTLPALSLVCAAYRFSPASGEQLGMELRRLLFESGVDISDAQVLTGLADRYGLDPSVTGQRDAVIEEWQGGQRRGVKGSPHFFAADRDLFCPLLEIEPETGGHLVIHPNLTRLTEFLEACWPEP